MKNFILIGLVGLLLYSCKSEDQLQVMVDGFHENMYNHIQEQLITTRAGSTVDIPAGEYHFSRPLSLDGIADVTIAGAGMDETVLSFKDQKSGAEGIKVTADGVTISGLTIADTKGDGIKLLDCDGIVLRDVNVTWTGGALETNGGYGLYPVSSQNVLIENCETSYASDAGIYVGQSENVIVRNNYAHHNVAGIEIENCKYSQVYNNKAENNTGGILVFDLPDLPAGNGHSCEVFDNEIINNNHPNFAPEGNIVATVPPGTGIILLAAKKVEVHGNKIIGHKTVGTSVSSYILTQRPFDPEKYDPFSYDIAIYDNEYGDSEEAADVSTDLGQLVSTLFQGEGRDIVIDGISMPGKTGSNAMNICLGANGDADFANIDAANEFKNLSLDASAYQCEGVRLADVEI